MIRKRVRGGKGSIGDVAFSKQKERETLIVENPRGREMIWPISIYMIASIAIACWATFNNGWTTGLCAIATSVLYVIAGARFKAIALHQDGGKGEGRARHFAIRFRGIMACFGIMLLAEWPARNFSLQIYGHVLSGKLWGLIGSGELWGLIGFATGFYAYRRTMTKAERDAEDGELKNERNF